MLELNVANSTCNATNLVIVLHQALSIFLILFPGNYFDRNSSALYSIASVKFMNKNRQLEISGNVCQQFLDWKCHSNCACAFTIQSWFSLWTYSIYQIPSFDLLKFSMLFQMIYRDPNPLNSFKNKLIKFRIFWSNWPEAYCLFPVVCKWTEMPLVALLS